MVPKNLQIAIETILQTLILDFLHCNYLDWSKEETTCFEAYVIFSSNDRIFLKGNKSFQVNRFKIFFTNIVSICWYIHVNCDLIDYKKFKWFKFFVKFVLLFSNVFTSMDLLLFTINNQILRATYKSVSMYIHRST